MANALAMRRLWEAAKRDRTPQRFFEEFGEALRKGEVKAHELRVRELFEAFVDGGRELINSWNPRHSGGYGGYNTVLLEERGSVSTAAFRALTGNAIYQHVLDEWNSPEFIGDKLVTTMPSSMQQEELPGAGDFGDVAEEVPEQGDYQMAGLNEELVRMPKTKKRGFRVCVTKEIVFFDRFGLVLKRASDVTRVMRVNKEKRILDVVLGIVNPYIRNDVREDTYQSTGSSVNLKTSNGLSDWKNVEAAEQQFEEMTSPNSGELVTTIPNTILVPGALQHTAKHIINATQIRGNTGVSSNVPAVSTYSASTLKDYEILTNPYVKQRLASSTTWFLGDFKRAFAYMENWPITVEDMPMADAAYNNDIVAGWKASERGACGVLERRHVQKNTA